MIMINPIVMSVKTPTIDNKYPLEKKFIELILLNPWMVLY